MATAMSWVRSELGRTASGIAMGMGGLMIAVAYLMVSNEGTVAGQLAVIVAGGGGGLLLAGGGACGLILIDLLDEWYKLDRIEMVLAGVPAEQHGRARPMDVPLFKWAVITAGVGFSVAVVLEVIGWTQAHASDDPDQMFGALGFCVAGSMAAGGAALLATLVALRRVRLRGAELFAPWIVAGITSRAPAATRDYVVRSGQVEAAHPPPSGVVVGPDLSRYHLRECAVVAGHDEYRQIPRAEIADGTLPCGICLGDVEPMETADHTSEMVIVP